MDTITIYYSHDHENDTKIVYSFLDNKESHLDCYYTSEDPDYGTDKIIYNSEPSDTVENMACDLRKEISEYLDKTNDGINRPGDADEALEKVYGDYSNSTLYAIENALRVIEGEPTEITNSDGNQVAIMTVKEAAKYIMYKYVGNERVKFDIGVGDFEGRNLRINQFADSDRYPLDMVWYGVKQIMNNNSLFDGDWLSGEMIILCGHYGGGSVNMAYYDYNSGYDDGPLVKAICESCEVNPDERIFIETIRLDKEGK